MVYFDTSHSRTGLLVSVRNADEARTALAGGVDVIDVKEPSRGPLGAADVEIVAEVMAAVGERVPTSIAAGELMGAYTSVAATSGAAFAKFGLAGCRTYTDWLARWHAVVDRLPGSMQAVAVVYADWEAAAAPPPDEVLAAAIASSCPALLIDTWDKSRGTLFDHWPAQDVARFCERVHAAGIGVVLAGSLNCESLQIAAACRPDLIAVRGAACNGGRFGPISAARIQTIQAELRRVEGLAGDKLLSP